jgi:hypothetical protein
MSVERGNLGIDGLGNLRQPHDAVMQQKIDEGSIADNSSELGQQIANNPNSEVTVPPLNQEKYGITNIKHG